MEVSDLLEPCALSGASTVLRRRRISNDPLLSDECGKLLQIRPRDSSQEVRQIHDLILADQFRSHRTRIIDRMGQEREDRIISSETNLTVAGIFLMDDLPFLLGYGVW